MLILCVFITCLGSSFLVGYNLGILNLPEKHVKEFLSKSILGHPASESAKNAFPDPSFLYAQVSTTFVVAAAIGAFSCGWLADSLGRRSSLLLNHAFAITGGIMCSLCVKTQLPALLFIGRFIVGINCGISIGICALYLTEIAPQDKRGAIGACNQLAITVGIVVSYLMTLSHSLNTEILWPVAVGLGAVPAAIALIILPFCQESPRFLFIKKHNEEAARKAFSHFNPTGDVELFIKELRDEMEVVNNQPEFKFSQLFTQKDLRMAVAIACLIQVMQQLSGINAVITYSSTMMKSAKVKEGDIEYCVVGIGLLNVIVTVISLPLLERFGRRTLALWPSIVLAVSLLVLTVIVSIGRSPDSSEKLKEIMATVSVVFIFIYIIGFALGLGPVPHLIVSELFRQGPRAAAYSLSQCLQWLSNLIVLCSYPSVDAVIGGYSFLPFLIVVVICWIFLFLFMPETRNRKFDDIARDLALGKVVIGQHKVPIDSEAA